jgi:hypothetical protein
VDATLIFHFTGMPRHLLWGNLLWGTCLKTTVILLIIVAVDNHSFYSDNTSLNKLEQGNQRQGEKKIWPGTGNRGQGTGDRE